MTGLRLILKSTTKPWENSSLTGHAARPRAPQVPNFEAQVLVPIVCGRPGSWVSNKGRSSLKGSAGGPTAPTPSLTRRIEAFSFICRRKRRIITCRRASLTLRSPTAFFQNGDTRSPDANSSWRRPAPNPINEGHALVPERRGESRERRRRRAGKKPPPPGAVLQKDQSRVKIRPKTASPNSRIKRVA
ncbi:putative acid phosphatase [Trypanosoma cruzi]|nr:putative acid phosphatase [Trypanosoma cruzi]